MRDTTKSLERLVPLYQYKPLISPDAVRIVALEPAKNFQDHLRCRIIEYSRVGQLADPDDSKFYSAVSYTWGATDRICLVCLSVLMAPKVQGIRV